MNDTIEYNTLTNLYTLDKIKGINGIDLLVYNQHNSISVITIDNECEFMKNHFKNLKEINFTTKELRSTSLVVKKSKKKPAIFVRPDSNICKFIMENGEEFKVKAGIYGKLVQINEELKNNHSLLTLSPHNCYLAIVFRRLEKDHN